MFAQIKDPKYVVIKDHLNNEHFIKIGTISYCSSNGKQLLLIIDGLDRKILYKTTDAATAALNLIRTSINNAYYSTNPPLL